MFISKIFTMPHDYDGIVTIWKNKYSDKISSYTPYKVTQQFERFAKLFAPGDSYFYILNLHDLSLDYISESVERILGMPYDNVSINDLLAVALPEELQKLEKKEILIDQFFNHYLTKEQLTAYKAVHCYRIKDKNEKICTMLLQTMVLTHDDKGSIEHVLTIHSDISHLKVMSTRDVSFIHLNNGTSFYNLNPNKPFNIKSAATTETLLYDELTKREREIVNFMAKGYDANYIAECLFLSIHTVRTHKKNILRKTNCSNGAELVAKCLMSGLVL